MSRYSEASSTSTVILSLELDFCESPERLTQREIDTRRDITDQIWLPPLAAMADPFEVRMRFSNQLQHLNASVTSSQKAAQYALKYKDLDEDLHNCILEQLEKVLFLLIFLLILVFPTRGIDFRSTLYSLTAILRRTP
jgi:hypothetical protein